MVLALRGRFVAWSLPRPHSTNLRLPRRLRRLPARLTRHSPLRHLQVWFFWSVDELGRLFDELDTGGFVLRTLPIQR